jgi:epoxyqueuosine reductase
VIRNFFPEVPTMNTLTHDVKALALSEGADLVGVAPVDRFQEAPRMTHPQAIIPDAKSVVVIAIKYPDAAIDGWGKPPAESMFFYQSVQVSMTATVMPMITFKLYRFLEKAGYLALPVAPSGFYRYRDYKEIQGGFIADFSHRHAAVAAGLGEFGRQGLLLTPQFGVRQRMASVITNAPLQADPLYNDNSLCDGCEACLKACPVAAFHQTEQHSPRIGDRTFTYARVDKWRCAWVEQLGMVGEGGPKYEGYTTNFYPPSPVTPEDYLKAMGQRDPFQATCGWGTISCGRCLHACNAHRLHRRESA